MLFKVIKEVWELLCIVAFGVPAIVVGYFGTFVYYGLVTGHELCVKLHKDEPTNDKTLS